MNPQSRPRRATYQDVIDAPPNLIAEIAGGNLHVHPLPGSTVARAKFHLAGRLGAVGPEAWHFAIEPELHFGEDVLVPDLAGWRRERMPIYPDAPFFTLAPDWICEILSPGTRHPAPGTRHPAPGTRHPAPGTRRFDLTEKRALYGANGVAHLWLLDPDARTLEAFQLVDGAWTLTAAFQDGDDIRAAPFETLAFPLNALSPA